MAVLLMQTASVIAGMTGISNMELETNWSGSEGVG